MAGYDRNYFENLLTRVVDNSPRNLRRLQMVRAACPGGRLLEIGCGLGNFLWIARRYFEVEGLELSEYAAQKAQARGLAVRSGDVQMLELPQARYDALAAFNVLEHLPDPQAALARIRANLKPGGVLVGSVPNNSGLVGGAATRLSNIFDRTHVSTFAPARWLTLFREAGFGEVDAFGELLLGPNHSYTVRGRYWAAASFNMLFVCRRTGGLTSSL